MGRRMGIDRARFMMPDEQEIKHDAIKYVRAQEFIRRMYKHRDELSHNQMRDLRKIALDGDIMAANERMWEIIGGEAHG